MQGVPAEHACRLNPFLGLFFDVLIHSRWPFVLVGSTRTPDVFDRVSRQNVGIRIGHYGAFRWTEIKNEKPCVVKKAAMRTEVLSLGQKLYRCGHLECETSQ